MDIEQILAEAPKNQIIQKTLLVAHNKLSGYRRIACAISGGADSDIVIDLMERVRGDREVLYVWYNTGMEYQATRRHLDDLEAKYGVQILRRRAKVPAPAGCKRYGLPFLSKRISDYIARLQRHGFQWEDEPFDVLYARYPRCKVALRWWCNQWGDGSRFNIASTPYLKEFLIDNPPWFDISGKCCDGAKKDTAHGYDEEYEIDLKIMGLRKAEGGTRSTAYKTCFTEHANQGIAEYRPLYFWADRDKREYEEHYNIQHSDCYERYGLRRTGCAGCPYGRDYVAELEALRIHEPQMYRAAWGVFGDSYRYTRMYHSYRALAEDRGGANAVDA